LTTGSTTQAPPPGWYQDPEGPGQRYFDGAQWTEHRSGVQQMPPAHQAPHQGGPPPIVGPTYAQPRPPKKNNTWKWIVGGFVALVVVVVATNSGSGTSTDKKKDAGSSNAQSGSSSKTSEKAQQKAKGNEDPEKPNNASDDYTPHVAASGQVTVDGIVYSVSSVKQRESIGDSSIGLDEQASGTYLVVNMTAHSTKGQTETLTDDTFKVSYDGGPEYSADTDGTVALTMEGGSGSEEPFFLTDLQPDSDEKGAIVFDVPNAALGKKLELRINELGFGETHGFIRLNTK
jgi:hypothetical protein